MIKVGITGGIGSGKTIICKIFEQLGVKVFYADVEAKKLYTQNIIIEKIKKVFGTDVFNKENEIDKKKLANIVFANPAQLEKLNNIIHPAVIEKFNEWSKIYSSEKYILKEAAILFESNSHIGLDFVISVSAPINLRIERVMKRDGLTEQAVLQRIEKQYSEEERNKRADFIVYNDDKQLVIPQVLAIHHALNSFTKI